MITLNYRLERVLKMYAIVNKINNNNYNGMSIATEYYYLLITYQSIPLKFVH